MSSLLSQSHQATMDDYQVEVDKFLQSVEELSDTDGTEKDSEVVVEEEVTNDVATAAVVKKPRFRWKFGLVAQKIVGATKVTVNPFLDDKNVQDLLFSKKLLESAPYRAAYKSKKEAFDNLVLTLSNLQVPNGKTPPKMIKPLELISVASVKGRLASYLERTEQWSDKTGAVFANGKPPDANLQFKEVKDMSVSEKIYHYVDLIIEDHQAFNADELKKTNDAAAAEKRQNEGMRVIMDAAMAKVGDEVDEVPYDDTVTPSIAKSSQKKAKSSSSSSSGNHYSNESTSYEKICKSIEETTVKKNIERELAREQREKRKHEHMTAQIQIEKDRSQTEMMKINADNKRNDLLLQFQMDQAKNEERHRMEMLEFQRAQLQQQSDRDKRDAERDKKDAVFLDLIRFLVDKSSNANKSTDNSSK